MTPPEDIDDRLDALGPDGGPDVVLRSFAVRARFRRAADDGAEAERTVRAELEPLRGTYDDATVEPQEPDGRWAVDVRFVVASLDGATAVEGVHTTLHEHGLTPDEAWVAEHLP